MQRSYSCRGWQRSILLHPHTTVFVFAFSARRHLGHANNRRCDRRRAVIRFFADVVIVIAIITTANATATTIHNIIVRIVARIARI